MGRVRRWGLAEQFLLLGSAASFFQLIEVQDNAGLALCRVVPINTAFCRHFDLTRVGWRRWGVRVRRFRLAERFLLVGLAASEI